MLLYVAVCVCRNNVCQTGPPSRHVISSHDSFWVHEQSRNIGLRSLKLNTDVPVLLIREYQNTSSVTEMLSKLSIVNKVKIQNFYINLCVPLPLKAVPNLGLLDIPGINCYTVST